jgi:hypothetical protein
MYGGREQFVEMFPDFQIVHALSRQLGWSHFKEILPIKDRLKREFYTEMCRLEKWSVRTLRAKIDGMLYERTTLSGKPEQVIDAEIAALRETDQLMPDLIFHDPYLLDFLGLQDNYSESDLENAIIRDPVQPEKPAADRIAAIGSGRHPRRRIFHAKTAAAHAGAGTAKGDTPRLRTTRAASGLTVAFGRRKEFAEHVTVEERING